MKRVVIAVAVGVALCTVQTGWAQKGPSKSSDEIKKLQAELEKLRDQVKDAEARLEKAKNAEGKRGGFGKGGFGKGPFGKGPFGMPDFAKKKDFGKYKDMAKKFGGKDFGKYKDMAKKFGGKDFAKKDFGKKDADKKASRPGSIEQRLDRIVQEIEAIRREVRKR